MIHMMPLTQSGNCNTFAEIKAARVKNEAQGEAGRLIEDVEEIAAHPTTVDVIRVLTRQIVMVNTLCPIM